MVATVRLPVSHGAMLRSIWRFPPRQPRDPKHRAFTGRGGDFNAVSEQGCQAVNDSQSDPEALDGSVGLLVASVKLAEDLTELIRRDADAGVPDLDADRRSAASAPDQHPSPLGVPDRVGNQVPQDSFQE